MRLRPTADDREPMLHQQAKQFGVDFAENTQRLLRSPKVDEPSFFPQAPDQLDLPPSAHQGSCLKRRKKRLIGIGEQDCPARERQTLFARMGTMMGAMLIGTLLAHTYVSSAALRPRCGAVIILFAPLFFCLLRYPKC